MRVVSPVSKPKSKASSLPSVLFAVASSPLFLKSPASASVTKVPEVGKVMLVAPVVVKVILSVKVKVPVLFATPVPPKDGSKIPLVILLAFKFVTPEPSPIKKSP